MRHKEIDAPEQAFAVQQPEAQARGQMIQRNQRKSAEAPKHEGMREDPLSPYAAAKLAGELYCRSFARVYGLPVVVTRFFNVFGPRQVPDSQYSGVVAAFCFALLRGTQPRIDGDGGQSRDFTYVENAVQAVIKAADAPAAVGKVLSVAP